MSRENVEVVRRCYPEINRVFVTGEIAPFLLEFFDPQIEYQPVEEGSVVRGHEGYAEYLRRMREAWEGFRLELEEVIDAGDSIVGTALMHGRGRASGIEITQRLFSVAEMTDLKIVRLSEYVDRQEALAAVGLSE